MEAQIANDEGLMTSEQPAYEASTPPSPSRRKKPMANSQQQEEPKLTPIEGGKNRGRKIGLLPTAADERTVTYQAKVVSETVWAQLPARRLFSVASDGSHPYFKLSKSSYVDLVTEEVTTNVPISANNRVYRVSLA